MGILPEEMGDVIIPYTGITTKTGSDFDIDKMYLMIPAFNAKFPKKDIAKGSQYIRDNKITRREIVNILESLSYPDIGQEEDKLVYDTFIKERSEEHTSELQSRENLVCRLLLEKKNATYVTETNKETLLAASAKD